MRNHCQSFEASNIQYASELASKSIRRTSYVYYIYSLRFIFISNNLVKKLTDEKAL